MKHLTRRFYVSQLDNGKEDDGCVALSMGRFVLKCKRLYNQK